MSVALFLDDERWPPADGRDWAVVRSSQEAIAWCQTHGAPAYISFDHDLGGEDTALPFVHWLINRDLDQEGRWLPPDFTFYVHSQNGPGARNIHGWMSGYLAQREPTRSDGSHRPRSGR